MIIRNKLQTFALLSVLLLVTKLLSAQSWPAGIHDPSSIVKCDDTYWIFGTGDGIYSIYSKDLITWKAGPTPFTKTVFPSWIKTKVPGFEGTFWAPDIIHMNNQYYLYYSCSEWGTMTSTIGCVTNKTLNPDDPDYEWVDVGFLGIWSYQPGVALNAIDPSLLHGHDGKIWMVYGSFNERGIVVTEIDSISGKPKTYAGNLPGVSIANSWTGPQSSNYGEGEGGAMIYHDGYYYIFYNKGGCCAGIASSYYMVMGRSNNPRGPFYDKEGKPMRAVSTKSGGTIVLKHNDSRGTDDRYYGPGHFGMYTENGVDYVTFHYYDPTGYYPNPAVNNQGGPTLGMAKLVWGDDGWPEISLDFIDKGVYTIENSYSQKVVDSYRQNLTDEVRLFQYSADTLTNTQKWFFNPIGSGEYAVSSYANAELYVETSGSELNLSSNYGGEINQRFRTLKSPNGKTIIYPSIENNVWGLSAPTTSDTKISVRSAVDHDIVHWNMIPFEEVFTVSETRLTLANTSGTDNSILVESNGFWSTEVNDESWLSIETSGVQNDTLRISVADNPNSADRINIIDVKSNGGKLQRIIVIQTGRPNTVAEISEGQGMLLYPNPADDQVFIDLKSQSMLNIYNQSGQKIYEQMLTSGINNLNIRHLPKGLYFFSVIQDTGVVVKKVLKK